MLFERADELPPDSDWYPEYGSDTVGSNTR